MDLVKDPDAPVYRRVAGYRMADGYYYHMGHNWLRFEHGGRIRVGLDDFALRLFGSPESIELPPLGEHLKQNKVGWAFGRTGHRAAVLAPASGTVLAVNHKARSHPDAVLLDPYQEGWLMILEPSFPKRDLKGLYYGDESDRWMEKEVQSLLKFVGADYEQMAATGAEPLSDVFGTLPGMDWDELTRTFLRTERTT
jgi:glycine cleavage system H lipoate-binding protein